MIKVFIIEDHEMYVEGLALLLKKQQDIDVTGTASNGTILLEKLPDLDADILLLDVHLPDINEEELLKKIRVIKPAQKIIYLTLMRGTRYVHKLIRHSIQGYILKNAPFEELLHTIHEVYKGGTYFSKEIDIISDNDFRTTLTLEERKVAEILSRREIEILTLICKEFSNIEIAEKLFLSVSTIETHRKNIIAKLGVNNTVGLVRFALKNKLIE
ncbi:MAG TPA: response regulator transcription factor [Chitinophagaceae bacterium]|nr:response regulator transcription factor [Chitinophagaceae bacterium]